MGGKKGKGEEMSKKTETKLKNKVIEDKTFGLKNKNKSKVVQEYCKTVTNQVKYGQEKGGANKREQEQYAQKKEKKKTDQQAALLASIFKSQQNLKGAGVEETASTQKVNMYADPRMGTDKMPQDTIITCKHFLDAVESELYGWRWVCPNKGEDCTYRHMLPEGYVLLTKSERDAQRKQSELDATMDTQTLEEKIEEERMALSSEGLTPVTKESFFAWKARRAERKQAELEEKMKEEEAKLASKGKAGGGGAKKGYNIMNGRALFNYKPDLFVDDQNAGDASTYAEEETKESEKKDGKEEEPAAVDESLFAGEAGDADEDVDFD